jgi:tRNA threonylcarbamoyladenosine biosynthesis protein TsaB
MSYILAIDTSVDACSVAISTPKGIKQIISVAPREHTQRLLPSIDTLLSDLFCEESITLNQFDVIAFGVGPGSFTGLRIALSTAQGLAYGADIPLLPISTLETMAHTAVRLGLVETSQIIIPAIDARMNEIYWSAYRYDEHSQALIPLCEESVCAPEVLAQHPLLASSSSSVLAIGSGWHYACLSNATPTSISTPTPPKLDLYPEAYDVAVLASRALASMENKDDGAKQEGVAMAPPVLVSPLAAEPRYIRDEISWKKRQRIREAIE